MDPLDLDDDVVSFAPSLLSRPVPTWPLHAVLGLSAAAIVVVVVLRSFIPALVAYGVLLVVGCGLLFYRRRLAIAATRRAGGTGFVHQEKLDRIALAALVVACLANGVVIALELASWDWGF
ncbi:MAG: hypothetical protein LBS56_06730 [Propionibacteriaceae bacterium]|nr:hypothetical protein [Propionibacteriaceae bacterium]